MSKGLQGDAVNFVWYNRVMATYGLYVDQRRLGIQIKERHDEAKHRLASATEEADEALGEAHEAFGEDPDQFDDDTQERLVACADAVFKAKRTMVPLDREKRSSDAAERKLLDRVLVVMGEMLEPDLHSAGFEKAADAWKRVHLRDLCGGPRAGEEEQWRGTWTTAPLEEKGCYDIARYLEWRTGVLAEMVAEGELPEDVLPKVDRPLRRFLETRGKLDEWPEGVQVPEGEQLLLDEAGDEDDLPAHPQDNTPIDPALDVPQTLMNRLAENGVTTVRDLRLAIATGRITRMHAMGEQKVRTVEKALESLLMVAAS